MGQGTLSAGVATFATSSLERRFPCDDCCVQRKRELRCSHQRGLIAVDRRLQLTPGSGGGSGSGSGERHYPNRSARRYGYLSAEHRAFRRHHLPNPGSIDGYRHARERYRSYHSLIVDSAHRHLVDFPGTNPAQHPHTDHPVAPRFGRYEERRSGPGKPAAHCVGNGSVAVCVQCTARASDYAGSSSHCRSSVASLGAFSILNGCAKGNGFFGQQQSSYTVTVTAISVPLTRSTKLTLNVE